MIQLDVLGCPCFAPGSIEEIETELSRIIDDRSGYTCAINAEKIMMHMENRGGIREIVEGSILPYPDGVGAVWGIRRYHGIKTFKVNMPKILLELCNRERRSLFLLGASEDSSCLAYAAISKQYPSINLVGRRNGFELGDPGIQELRTELKEKNPDVVLIGMGSPKQEILSHSLSQDRDRGIFVCCGGAIDILAGQKKRAPTFFIDNGLEWAYRLAHEPWRIKRQSVLLRFLARLALPNAPRKN